MFELHKVKQLPKIDSWFPGDEQEALELFGWEIDMLLDKDVLDSFYVTYNDKIVSVIQIDEVGNLTYFTTSHISEIPVRDYLSFLKGKMDCYQELVDVELTTEVAKDYAAGIFTLKRLGFEPYVEMQDRWVYGKQKEDS